MNSRKRKYLTLLLKLGSVVLVFTLLFCFVVTVRIVRGNAMYPSVRDGQLILISRLSRVFHDSVVLYRTEDGKEQIGRVLGTEGEEVVIDPEEGIYVNGNYQFQTIPFISPNGELAYPYRVPEDSLFLLNDYREDISDSRTFGAVSKKAVLGVVIFAMQYRGF